jgi:hypothetical protein
MIGIRLSKYNLIELLKRISQNGICKKLVKAIILLEMLNKKPKFLMQIC